MILFRAAVVFVKSIIILLLDMKMAEDYEDQNIAESPYVSDSVRLNKIVVIYFCLLVSSITEIVCLFSIQIMSFAQEAYDITSKKR